MDRTAKLNAARKALEHLQEVSIIGMGTGSTVECLLDLLSLEEWALNKTYVVSSMRTLRYMQRLEFTKLYQINDVSYVEVYIDGADWVDKQGLAIKGYGAAMLREKLLAKMANKRICIAGENKLVPAITGIVQPLPIEVLNIARSYVARELTKNGWRVVYREAKTDQGNDILDLFDNNWQDPIATENYLKAQIGIVESGLFAHEYFHEVLIGSG